jgi:flagellar hook-length control protein FliK
MEISFEPVLPATSNRSVSIPAEDAASSFEEVFRAEPQSRHVDASPSDRESPSSGDVELNAAGDASGPAPKSETAPEETNDVDEATVEETSETTVAGTQTAATVGQPPAPHAEFDSAAEGAVETTGEKAAGKADENSPQQNALPATSGEAAAATQSPGVEHEGKPQKPKPTPTPIVAREASADSAEEKPVEPRKSVAGNEKSARREIAVADKVHDREQVGLMEAAVQAAEVDAADRPREQLDPSFDPASKLTEQPQDRLAENVPPEAAAKVKDPAEAPLRSSSAFNDADAKAVRLSAGDRVRFVQRVARAIEAARPDGEIRLRLRPPALGSIHLSVRTEDGVLAARVETETLDAQTLLSQRVPELRERLAEMNIRVERFDVEWRGGQEERSSSFAHHGPGDNRDFGLPRPAGRRHEAAERPPAEISRSRLHRGDLDVLV